MFQKPFKVKSNTQLKGSERKKIRAEVLKNFPQLSEEDLQLVLPPKDAITAMKIFTHTSEQVMVYCSPSVPLIFEIEKVMYPTVYFLWEFPELLYTYTTWDPVVSKIMNGADLMLPGVVVKLPYTIKSFGKLEKGERVAVNTTTNKAPIAVGKTALSSLDMYMSAKRGKGVQVLHSIGDHLWFQPQRPKIPELGIPAGLEESVTEEYAQDEEENNSEDDTGSSESGDECEEAQQIQEEPENVLVKTLEELSVEQTDPQESMDALLRYCFLKAWRSASKKITVPLLTSNFFRLHMIPACPENHNLDVKKSSFKKISAFLSEMCKEEIIKVKEQVKGVESIVEVNLNHPAIRRFELWPDDVPNKETDTQGKAQSDTAPTVVELYKISANVLPIFVPFNHKKGDSVTAATVRDCVTSHVKQHNLQDPQNPRLVILDVVLQNAVEDRKSPAAPADQLLKLSWEELFQKCFSRMTRTFYLTATGPTVPTQTKSGKLEPIDIRVSMRSGNKKVTLINNLELFGINCPEFARKCQHGVAASTSISAVPGKKSAQLLVQGNQVDFVGKLLTGEYKIPLRYIRGLENAPPKKKNKGKK